MDVPNSTITIQRFLTRFSEFFNHKSAGHVITIEITLESRRCKRRRLQEIAIRIHSASPFESRITCLIIGFTGWLEEISLLFSSLPIGEIKSLDTCEFYCVLLASNRSTAAVLTKKSFHPIDFKRPMRQAKFLVYTPCRFGDVVITFDSTSGKAPLPKHNTAASLNLHQYDVCLKFISLECSYDQMSCMEIESGISRMRGGNTYSLTCLLLRPAFA